MIKGGPKIIEDGLVLNLDASDKKSFSGIDVTNVSNGVNYSWGNGNSSTLKSQQNIAVIDIPQIGKRTVKFYYFYNDYNGGSGACCPSIFNYGTGRTISPSTTYTYSIIYKTESGYTHPNFMYRYEYNSSWTYLTESGVFNNSNRIHLGDGWYKAWGTFTSQSTAAYAHFYLFYYQYVTYDTIYVADVSVHADTYIPHHRHFPTSSSNGGWKDTSGNSNNGTLQNGVSWSNDNQGSLDFDGSDQYIDLGTISSGDNLYISQGSIELWFKYSTSQNGVILGWGDGSHWGNLGVANNWTGSVSNESIVIGSYKSSTDYYAFYVTDGADYYGDGNWHHIVFTKGVNNSTNIACYIDGVQKTMLVAKAGTGEFFLDNTASSQINVGRRVYSADNAYYDGQVASIKIYSDILTQAEALQNYNATKGRFL